MNRYEGSVCSACEKVFTAEDDVVVCPVCGTPHHRECWNSTGSCTNAGKHAEGYSWQPENNQAENFDDLPKADNSDEESETAEFDIENDKLNARKRARANGKCPHCHEETPVDLPYCLRCGGALMAENQSLCPRCGTTNDKNSNFCARCGMILPQGQTYRVSDNNDKVCIRPLDKMYGITISEASTYIQVGSDKYIPNFFKRSLDRKKVGWNWASFFLAPYWFFYRKMYAIGAAMIAMMVPLYLIIAPYLQPFMDAYTNYIEVYNSASSTSAQISEAYAAVMPHMQAAMPYVYAFVLAMLVLHVLCGLFSDWLYRNKMLKDIKRWKSLDSDPATYQMNLLRKGGVSPLIAAASVFFLPFAVNLCSMLISALKILF